MALGLQRPRQSDMVVTWAELPRSPGHIFYDRLQSVLIEAAFDSWGLCAPLHAARRTRRGARSLDGGAHRVCGRRGARCRAASDDIAIIFETVVRYFRMLLVGYFEGIDSERGLERANPALKACTPSSAA
jgi:transposase